MNAESQQAQYDPQDDSPFPLGGATLLRLILGIFVVLILTGGIAYYFYFYRNSRTLTIPNPLSQTSPSPTPTPKAASLGEINQQINTGSLPTDLADNVNYVHSLIKQYRIEINQYPATIQELQQLFSFNSSLISVYANPPYYYKKTNDTYEYYAKVGNETYKGETEKINKNLDASVKYTVDHMSQIAYDYSTQTGRHPINTDELVRIAQEQGIRVLKNPFTRKPNAYSLINNGTGYRISGKLSTRQEYTVTQ